MQAGKYIWRTILFLFENNSLISSVGKEVEQLGLSYIASEKVNYYSHFEKLCWCLLQKKKKKLNIHILLGTSEHFYSEI